MQLGAGIGRRIRLIRKKDREVAERLSHGLQENGFSVWWDRHISGGSEFAKEIERELEAAKSVVVLWSAASVDSDWVRDEAAHGRDTKRLIPIRIDDVRPPLGFRQVHALDWTGESVADGFTDVVNSVRRVVHGAAGRGHPKCRSRPNKSGRLVFGVGGFLSWRLCCSQS